MEYTYAIQSCCARLSHGSTMHIAVTWRTKNTVAHMFPGVNCNNSSSSVLMINEFAQVSLYWIVNWKKKKEKKNKQGSRAVYEVDEQKQYFLAAALPPFEEPPGKKHSRRIDKKRSCCSACLQTKPDSRDTWHLVYRLAFSPAERETLDFVAYRCTQVRLRQ